MILMIDNYDSFTYNLVQEIAQLTGEPLEVLRNDDATVDELLSREPRAIVISPGPGRPEDAGVSMELVDRAAEIPLLGICLGHQTLALVHGARVLRAPEPVHGKTSAIRHGGAGVFRGLPDPMTATRYHSLVVDRGSVPDDLEITAWTGDGLVMGLSHRDRPHHAVQFHPESYLTRDGMDLLANFLELAGLPVTRLARTRGR